jgi:uncharacterized protein (TIGR02145 family)
MKNHFFTLMLLGAMTLSVMMGCNEKEAIPGIKVENEEALTQTAFADETGGSGGVTFVASAAWTSSITESATAKAAMGGLTTKSARAETDSWVSIDPNHGDAAGRYTIIITLKPNYTGSDRSATVTISCNGTDITVSVSQKGTTEDGEVPEDPNDGGGIELDADNVLLIIGHPDGTAAAQILKETGGQAVTFTSNNSNIVGVRPHPDGYPHACEIYAVNAGDAVITATTVEGNFTATCSVTVEEYNGGDIPITGIGLKGPDAMTLEVGGKGQLVAIVEPENATNRAVKWSSNNPAVATVESDDYYINGWITAKSVGTALITVETVEGGFTATCTVTVLPPTHVEGVVINGVHWATHNVDAPGSFASTPESAGMYYRWRETKGWPPDGAGMTEYTINIDETEWTAEYNPCPAGWRVPTITELGKLADTKNVTSERTTQNGVVGWKFTDNATSASIFMPAAGMIYLSDGQVVQSGIGTVGNYWSTDKQDNTYPFGDKPYGFAFGSNLAYPATPSPSSGISIRPVAE